MKRGRGALGDVRLGKKGLGGTRGEKRRKGSTKKLLCFLKGGKVLRKREKKPTWVGEGKKSDRKPGVARHQEREGGEKRYEERPSPSIEVKVGQE